MTTHDERRRQVQATLGASPTFLSLPAAEQAAMYRDLITPPDAPVQALASRGRRAPETQKASDLIDDRRHENRRIDQAGELAGEFIDQVDFPQFVKDLLEGVFDANLKVTIEQMQAYQDLLKTATQSLATFVQNIDEAASFAYLAENSSDEFNFDFGDEDENGEAPPVLTDKDGNVVATGGEDIGDNQLKARIMDSKIKMAQEQRALLRETILMGVTRLVVEKGVVKASVLFDVKATEQIKKSDKAGISKSRAETKEIRASSGLIGKIFGGGGASGTRTTRKSRISVSSAKSQSDTQLAAKIAGSVEINFKSDYFKLDNFAEMYAPATAEERRAAEAPNGTRAP
ncbi:MAG: hypothetical protein HKN91_14415 [Acidimicrobiia bacterium]|nr:hypothetical protein [Acidimicrobiia bacterium]